MITFTYTKFGRMAQRFPWISQNQASVELELTISCEVRRTRVRLPQRLVRNGFISFQRPEQIHRVGIYGPPQPRFDRIMVRKPITFGADTAVKVRDIEARLSLLRKVTVVATARRFGVLTITFAASHSPASRTRTGGSSLRPFSKSRGTSRTGSPIPNRRAGMMRRLRFPSPTRPLVFAFQPSFSICGACPTSVRPADRDGSRRNVAITGGLPASNGNDQPARNAAGPERRFGSRQCRKTSQDRSVSRRKATA